MALLATAWLYAGLPVSGGEPHVAGQANDYRNDYQFEVTVVSKGYDGKTCWMHARAGAIPPNTPGNPSQTPVVVMTLQKLQVEDRKSVV